MVFEARKTIQDPLEWSLFSNWWSFFTIHKKASSFQVSFFLFSFKVVLYALNKLSTISFFSLSVGSFCTSLSLLLQFFHSLSTSKFQADSISKPFFPNLCSIWTVKNRSRVRFMETLTCSFLKKLHFN